MKQEEVLALIQEAYRSVEDGRPVPEERWKLDARLTDLGISSVTALEMAGYLEDRLDIELPDDELANVSNMSQLIGLIERAVAA